MLGLRGASTLLKDHLHDLVDARRLAGRKIEDTARFAFFHREHTAARGVTGIQIVVRFVARAADGDRSSPSRRVQRVEDVERVNPTGVLVLPIDRREADGTELDGVLLRIQSTEALAEQLRRAVARGRRREVGGAERSRLVHTSVDVAAIYGDRRCEHNFPAAGEPHGFERVDHAHDVDVGADRRLPGERDGQITGEREDAVDTRQRVDEGWQTKNIAAEHRDACVAGEFVEDAGTAETQIVVKPDARGAGFKQR